MILAGGFIEWIFWAIRESTIHSQLGHVRVFRPGYLDSGRADPYKFLLPWNSDQQREIEDAPGVVALAPRLSFHGLISRGESTWSFIGEGVDPGKEVALSQHLHVEKGRELSSGDPGGILLGQGLASILGVDVNDTVVILVSTASGGINALECTVRGFFVTAVKSYDDSAIRLPLETAQNLLRVSGSHSWALMLRDTSDTDYVLNTLRARFVGQEYEFVPWYEMADFYTKTVGLFSKQVGVMKLIIAVIIILSITNTMMMSVLARTAEIGTVMALGATRGRILSGFLVEGVILGAIGGTLGLALGYLLAWVISAVGIPMPPPPGMAQGYVGQILVSAPLAADALLLAIGTTLLASLYPAWRASRMVIVDALRNNQA